MDKLTFFRKCIKNILSQYHLDDLTEEGYDSQLIFDEERDHYLWLDLGWEDSKRIYFTVIHFDIKDDKIWLQRNMTDLDPAKDLIEMGVEYQDIILGLQAPFKRPYTDYGVA